MSSVKKIVVIGSGIGGLATAARLAAKGFEVTVVEKNDFAGGKLGYWEKDGFCFDKGPSLFIQPAVHEELYRSCGKDPEDYLPYKALDVITHYFFEDGTKLNFYPDPEKTARELADKLNVKASVVRDYLTNAANIYEKIGKIFLDEPIHSLSTWTTSRIPKALAATKWNYLLQTMHGYNTMKLQHPKLVQLFDRYATYNGSDPYQTPSMLTMIPHFEITEGTYYPLGGMVSIPRAVFKLCSDLGVQFHFNTPAEKIITEDNVVKGVIAGGKRFEADAVVSNSDVYFTYRDLLDDKSRATQLAKQERSTSGFIFYWGIDRTFPELGLHNIFFAENYKAEFESIFKKKKFHSDPTIYINITSKEESKHAPPGCENWFVFINAPGTDIANSEALAVEAKMVIIEKLKRMLGVDISKHILVENKLTPQLVEQITGGYMGSLYGTASNKPMAAFNRHSNRSKKYKGLYFAGGTVHPGGGIPLCLRSAKLVSDLIGNPLH